AARPGLAAASPCAERACHRVLCSAPRRTAEGSSRVLCSSEALAARPALSGQLTHKTKVRNGEAPLPGRRGDRSPEFLLGIYAANRYPTLSTVRPHIGGTGCGLRGIFARARRALRR